MRRALSAFLSFSTSAFSAAVNGGQAVNVSRIAPSKASASLGACSSGGTIIGGASKINLSGEATRLVDETSFKERSGGRDHAPAEASEPQAIVTVGQKALDVGAVGDCDGSVKAAAARIVLASFLVAQAVRCRGANDASGGGERRDNVA